MLKVNVYVAALYVTKIWRDPTAVLDAPTAERLILGFVRDVGRSDLNKAWDERFEANAEGQLPAPTSQAAVSWSLWMEPEGQRGGR